MNILEKDQIEQKLGKFGLFSGKARNYSPDMQYLGGIPSIDKLIEKKEIDAKIAIATFEKRPKGLELYLLYGFSKTRIGLDSDKLNFWTIEQQEEIVAKKSKSVIGRALLGGILLGPVGAVVGGMTGIGDKKVMVSDIENIISISYSEKDEAEIILLSCSNKNIKKIYEYLKLDLGDKYKKPEEVKFENKKELKNSTISIADELIKLKGLLDGGVLTNEEFKEEKKKLLNN